MRNIWPAVAVIALSCSTAMAQTSPVIETSPPVPAAVVPNGTLISVEITELVTTRTAKPDDMFTLKLAEPVLLNTVVVIPAGIPGKGVVIDAGKPGMGGKPGKLVLAARYLEFEGRQIPIRGLKMNMSASDNGGTSAAASAVVGVFGLAVTGGHMEVQPGTHAVAKLGADFTPAPPVTPASVPQPDTAAPTPQTSQ
jgi:hypothetical protein